MSPLYVRVFDTFMTWYAPSSPRLHVHFLWFAALICIHTHRSMYTVGHNYQTPWFLSYSLWMERKVEKIGRNVCYAVI